MEPPQRKIRLETLSQSELDKIPDEILEEIMCELPLSDLAQFITTHQRPYKIAQSELFFNKCVKPKMTLEQEIRYNYDISFVDTNVTIREAEIIETVKMSSFGPIIKEEGPIIGLSFEGKALDLTTKEEVQVVVTINSDLEEYWDYWKEHIAPNE